MASRLSVMIKELETHMIDKCDEVYLAMRRDYNSVLGGGDVPRDGEILPKTQRLVRREMMRIIDGVEKVFSKIAGLEVKDEEDEGEEKEKAHGDQGEDGGFVGKEEDDEDLKVKREASPSTQLEEDETPHAGSSADEPTAGEASDGESETKRESSEDEERLSEPIHAQGKSEDSNESDDYAASGSD